MLIIADETANPEYVAADLLSQAEHDLLASSILVTTSTTLAEAVVKAIEAQTQKLTRNEIINKSLDAYGAIVVVPNLDEAVKISNRIAPEHLEINTQDPFALLSGIKNAGAIFLGEYSPEPVGDYFAGPNHTLPTAGTARFFSPLGVYDFIKDPASSAIPVRLSWMQRLMRHHLLMPRASGSCRINKNQMQEPMSRKEINMNRFWSDITREITPMFPENSQGIR